MKTVGVIGGMGPAATLHFLRALLDATPAGRDQDHLRTLVDNNPHVPDRNAALAGDGPSPGPALAQMAQGLVRSGAEVLVMPCNTAHAWQEDIVAAVSVPFLSIIDTTAAAVRRSGARRVGVLAAPGALDAGLYQRALAEFDPIVPAGATRARFAAVIYRIKAGDLGPEVREEMRAVAADLVEQGADLLVSACTEVPLALDAAEAPAPLVDCTVELARATVALARG